MADEARAPIAFAAALPHGRAALSVDAEGEGHLVLAIPSTELSGLTAQWDRLMDRVLLVAIVPEGELASRPPRRGGRRRRPDKLSSE